MFNKPFKMAAKEKTRSDESKSEFSFLSNSHKELFDEFFLKEIKVLAVEDNKVNAFLLKKLTDKFCFEMDLADNGNSALQLFSFKNYDVILMDIHLPDMNGYEITGIIRKMNDCVKSKIPIIAISSSLASELEDSIVKGEITDYVIKPFNTDELINKIYKYTSNNFSEK